MTRICTQTHSIRALCLTLVIVALGCWSQRAEAQSGVSGRFEDGVRKYREGDYDGAINEFENLFKEAPTNDAIVDVLDEVGLAVVVEMVADEDRRISGIGRTFFRLRREKNLTRVADESDLASAVASYFKANAQERHRMRIEFPLKYGRNIVPGTLSYLASPDADTRTAAELLIAYIGIDAVPVLVVAGGHPDAKVRASVARLLGSRNLRHPYNVACLVTLAHNDKDQTVREEARESLSAILEEQGQTEVFDAKLYHYENARQLYLNPHRNPFSTRFYKPAVYSLKGSDITSEPVATFQLSERMAESSLHEALKLDPQFQSAWAMLACTDAMLLVEYDLNTKNEDTEAFDRQIVETQAGQMQMRVARLGSISSAALHEALGKALEDQLSEIASRLVQVIAEGKRGGAVPESLKAALRGSPSREVRVRAATALTDWDDADLESVGEEIVEVLAEAILNSGVRTAHKIMGRPQNISRFDAILRKLAVDTFSNSVDVETGIMRARDIPPDFILVDTEAQSDVATGDIEPLGFFLKQLRASARTESIPVVVVVSPDGLEKAKELYQSEDNKVSVVSTEIESGEFKTSVLDEIFDLADDPRAEALGLSAMAAQTLSDLSRSNRKLPVVKILSALEEVLPNRPDEIRVPSIEALGFLGSSGERSAVALSEVFSLTSNSVDVREAAMTALGRVLVSGGGDDGVLNVIVTGMKDPNARLRDASFFAFGASGAPGDQRVEQLFDLSFSASPTEDVGETVESEEGEDEAGDSEETSDEEGEEEEEEEEFDEEEEEDEEDEEYEDEEDDEDYEDEEDDEDYEDEDYEDEEDDEEYEDEEE